MGVGGAALLFSCTPVIGSAIGGIPSFWLFGNPFYRGPMAGANCGPDVPGGPQCATGTNSSSSGSSSSSRSGSSFSSTSSSSHSSGATAGQSTSQRGGFGSTASSHSSGSSSS
jgi:hypothetical protein